MGKRDVGQSDPGIQNSLGIWREFKKKLFGFQKKFFEEKLFNLGSGGGEQVGWGSTWGGSITTSAMLTRRGPPGSERVTSGWEVRRVGIKGTREGECSRRRSRSNWRMTMRRRMGMQRIAILETVGILPDIAMDFMLLDGLCASRWILCFPVDLILLT